jgi:hypothetical protein
MGLIILKSENKAIDTGIRDTIFSLALLKNANGETSGDIARICGRKAVVRLLAKARTLLLSTQL